MLKYLHSSILVISLVVAMFVNKKAQELEMQKQTNKFKLDSLKAQFKIDSLHTTHSCWSDKKTKPFPKTIKEDYEKEYAQDIARMANY